MVCASINTSLYAIGSVEELHPPTRIYGHPRWPKSSTPPSYQLENGPYQILMINSEEVNLQHIRLGTDLAQFLDAMSTLEVLQMCPYQRKSLLFDLGTMDPSNDCMIVFNVEKLDHPCLPPSVSFHIYVSIKNVVFQWCIIDEGTSSCAMSANVQKKIISLDLSPSTITLCAYDGCPSQPICLCQNYLIVIIRKQTMIDVEVIDALLDYNLLLDHSFMQVMKLITSYVFLTIIFTHNWKIVITVQLT